MSTVDFEYDVALSFAGEDRACALDIATRLHAGGYRVFFDRFEELWGHDLTVKLQEVYARQSRYCVVLVSQHYLQKPWTNHERQILLSRAMKQQAPYLLPVRLDDAELPGLPDVIAYKDLRSESLPDLCAALMRLLGPPRMPAMQGAAASVAALPGVGLHPSDFLYAVMHTASPDVARFNIGYHLVNDSPEPRCLQWLEATVTPPGQRGIQLMWNLFIEIGRQDMWGSADTLPLPLAARLSRLHGAQFTGPRLASGMLWGEGEHGVEIAGWIERPARRREPDLCTRFTVDVSAADAASIEQWMQVQRSPGAAIGPAVAVPLAIGRR